MSMAIAHFAFGAGLTALVVTYLVPRVPYPRTLVVCGGLWAMVPDAHWVLPVFEDTTKAFHRSAWADFFWLHRTLDRVDVGDSKAVAAVLVGALLIATMLAERRDYRAARLVQETITEEEQVDPETGAGDD
jgi:hypothetical protein